MGEPWKYWTRVEFASTGHRRKSEVPAVKLFLQKHFPESAGQSKVSDREVQRCLTNWVRAGEEADRQMAQLGLHCYTTNAIEGHCRKFVNQFNQVDFDTLIGLVLQDEFIAEVIASYDPEKSALSTWTKMRIFSHRDVKRFLRLDHGIIKETDWQILCSTSPGALRRILGSERTAYEVGQGGELLQVFKEVYCGPLMAEREKLNQKSRRPYPQPTQQQLMKMALQLPPRPDSGWEDVLNQLRELAKVIRTDRAQPPVPPSARSDLSPEPQQDLLADYRSPCIAKAVSQVIETRLHHLSQGRNGEKKGKQYLNALGLFYCQGASMKDIARMVDLSDQPSVSRLLDRKTLKADISRHLVVCMRGCLDEGIGQGLSSPDRLKAWDQRVSTFLEEDVDKLMRADAKEGYTSQNRQMRTLLAQEICRYVQTVCRQCLKAACQCSG